MPQTANSFLGGSFVPGTTPRWAIELSHATPAVLTTFNGNFGTTPTLLLTPAQTAPLKLQTGGNPLFYLAVTNNAAVGGASLILTCPTLVAAPGSLGSGMVTIPPGQTAHWAGTAPDSSPLTWGTLMGVMIDPTYGSGTGIFGAASAGTIAATIVIG